VSELPQEHRWHHGGGGRCRRAASTGRAGDRAPHSACRLRGGGRGLEQRRAPSQKGAAPYPAGNAVENPGGAGSVGRGGSSGRAGEAAVPPQDRKCAELSRERAIGGQCLMEAEPTTRK